MENNLKWFLTDDFESFLKNPKKKFWENVDITYNLNEYKYKNDIFYFRQHENYGSGKEISCFGCSNTFGLGLPEKWTWPYELAKLYDLDKFSFKNYGLNGCSIEAISLIVYDVLIEQNKNVEVVYILFPDFFRYLYAFLNKNKLHTIEFNDQFHNNNFLHSNNIDISYLLMINGYYGFYKFLKSYNFIKEVCKNRNVPFYWHSWSENITLLDDQMKNNFLNDDNFLNNEQKDKLGFLYKTKKARDNRHAGHEYNIELAKYFYEKNN